MIAADAVAKLQRRAEAAACDAARGDNAERLLAWYDAERRRLPWRYAPGRKADPYRVWLSEIMLQQTTVKAVVPYFEAFVARWPTVRKLAAAPLDDVLAAWAGLGYYTRARNLHACAVAIVAEHGGRFPATEAELRTLPGIGPYTAAAIAAIAFGERATPVDGNVERVVARLFAVRDPLPAAKPLLRRFAAALTPADRPGDFAQAMMDLGATVCMPRRPSCLMCPLAGRCAARELGLASELPARKEKARRPTRRGTAFVALREDGYVLLRRRHDDGLLGGMMEVPSTEWTEVGPAPEAALAVVPARGEWWLAPGTITHVFTHFRLELAVYRALLPVDAPLDLWADPARCRWVHRNDLGREALPSIMRKVLAHALGP